MKTVKNRINLSHLLDLSIGLACLWFAYFMYFDLYSIFLTSVFLIIGFIPVGLFINYLVFGLNKNIIIGNNELIYNSGKERIKIQFSEIERVEVHELFRTDYWGLGFKYVKYYTKNKKTFIITNLMSDSFIFFNNRKPQIFSSIFPIVKTKWSEKKPTNFESKKLSLKKQYQELSNIELEKIIKPNSGYRKESKKIAQNILEKR